jgi:predicted ATPase
MIVTTRIVLRVYGEREFPVPPLGLPPAGAGPLTAAQAVMFEAVLLFVDRARAVQPSFEITDENAQQIVDICRRLDGLPLAIELAAARTRSLAVAAIHARLDSHLSLLTGGSRDLPGRQQTLRGAIDWSYDLLEDADRRLFERFSIHPGGAFLPQAEETCGPARELGEDVLDGLTSLSEKSLVRPDLGVDEDPRFTMLTTIRDYAHERLEQGQEFEALARRHAYTYLGLVETCAESLLGRDSRRLSDRLEQDHDNLRAALDWAVDHGETEFALRFLVGVWRFWQTRGHIEEARRRAEIVIAMPGIAGQPAELRARAYAAIGGITYWQADVRATNRYYGLGLEIARASGDDRLTAEALYNFSFASLSQDGQTAELYAAGLPYLEEALTLYERAGNSRGLADTQWALSQAIAAGGDHAAAIEHAEQALAEYRRLGDPFRIGWGLFLLAGLRATSGNIKAALPELAESLAIFAGTNDQSGILLNLAGFAIAAETMGQREPAARLGGAVETLRAATGAGLIDDAPTFIGFAIPKRPEDDTELLTVWEEGKRLSTEEAITFALEYANKLKVIGESLRPRCGR